MGDSFHRSRVDSETTYRDPQYFGGHFFIGSPTSSDPSQATFVISRTKLVARARSASRPGLKPIPLAFFLPASLAGVLTKPFHTLASSRTSMALQLDNCDDRLSQWKPGRDSSSARQRAPVTSFVKASPAARALSAGAWSPRLAEDATVKRGRTSWDPRKHPRRSRIRTGISRRPTIKLLPRSSGQGDLLAVVGYVLRS